MLSCGTGEMRITSGSRQSPSTPREARNRTGRARAFAPPITRMESWQPRCLNIARADHLQHVAQVGIDQLFQVTGLLTWRRSAGIVARSNWSAQGAAAQAEDRRIAQLPAIGAGRGIELRPHPEAHVLVVSHQPAKRRRALRARVALMHEAAATAPGLSSCICGTRRRNRRHFSCSCSAGCRPHGRGRNDDSACRIQTARFSLRSKVWPVRYCTPGQTISARRLAFSAIARSIACIEKVPSG